MRFSERLQAAYESIGESGQLDLYAQHGGGTYQQRPSINPLTGANEQHSPAFSLMRPSGNIRVRWHNFKGGEQDNSGDLFDFLKAVQSDSYARSQLGLDNTTVRPLLKKPPAPQPPAPPKQNYRPFALKKWQQSLPANKRVSDYLTSRNLTTPVPDTIRYHANDKMIVAKVVDIDGKFMAIHRTYLNYKSKRMLGSVAGGAVRLAEPVDGKLALTEGIEDGLAVLQATGIATWAGLSSNGLKAVQLPKSIVEVWIFADSDVSRVGQEAAQKLAARLVIEGRIVHIVYPVEQPESGRAVKKDFNDCLVEDATGQSIRDRLSQAVTFTISQQEPAPDSNQIKKACGTLPGKPTRGLLAGVSPAFNAGKALAANDASEKLKASIRTFLAEANQAILAKQEQETVEAERKKTRESSYADWLAQNPTWVDTPPPDELERRCKPGAIILPPGNVRRRLLKQALWQNPDVAGSTTPKLQIRGEAGLGKSTALAEALSTPPWDTRHIDYHVPTLNLAEDFARAARERGVKVRVIEGRKESNCIKPDAVKSAGKCDLNIMESCCIEKLDATKTVTCSGFKDCKYLAQFENQEPCVRVFTHDWLFLPRSSKLPKPDLIIVDENITQKAASVTSFHPDRLDDIGKSIIHNHIECGVPFRDSVIAAGITKESALEKAQALDAEIKISIHPNMPESMAMANISKLQEKSNRGAAAFWRQVAREFDFDRPYHGIEIIKDYKITMATGEELQNRVFVMHRKTIKRNKGTPVLLLDADANLDVNQLLFGENLREIVIRAKLNAHVVQVHSSVFTKMSLLTDTKLMDKVKQYICEEVALADGGGVLMVTSKKVRELLTGESANDRHGKPIAATHWQGADVAHFGGILGIDAWKDHSTVIVLGREQPWPDQVERLGRALFWDHEEPLNLTGKYTNQPRGYQLPGGQHLGVNVQTHSDNRIQGVLELIRERQSSQALARLRMVHSTEQKRVIIMSNVPLDIKVDELVTAKELFSGGSPLQQIWDKLPGVLPLNASWLSEKFSELIGSHDKASRLILNDSLISHFTYNLYMQSAKSKSKFKYRLKGHRGSHQICLSIHDIETTKNHLSSLFGKEVVSIERVEPTQQDEDDKPMDEKAVINQGGNAGNGKSNGKGNAADLPILLFSMNHSQTARTFGMMAGELYIQPKPVNDEVWWMGFERMAS